MEAISESRFFSKEKPTRLFADDKLLLSKFAWDLGNKLKKNNGLKRPVVVICIGTDRSTGDSFGPLVGSKLIRSNQQFYSVFGTLDSPVHANNLSTTIEEIRNRFENPLVIAIDACLGRIENVGSISIGEGAIHPGAGVNKILPSVGEISISGVVNVGGFMEYMVLQNTRLNLVMKIADLVATGLLMTIDKLYNKKVQDL